MYKIHKAVSLLVILYGCETWSLTLREEHRLRVFENKVLRRIFGRRRDEVTGGWRDCATRSFVIALFAETGFAAELEQAGPCLREQSLAFGSN
jgi:hypothetical protein